MARELREELGVPIGAIHSNWGGSQIRAWLTPEAGRALYGAEQMALLARIRRGPARRGHRVRAALGSLVARGSGGQEPWKNPDALAWQPVPSISAWPGWTGTPLASDTDRQRLVPPHARR